MIYKKQFLIFIALCFSVITFAQTKQLFSGQAGANGDYIYADFLDDEGTRCIVSDAINYTYPSICSFSLVKLIPKGDSTEKVRYALAVETSDFLPKNAKLVIICGQGRALSIMTMEQMAYTSTSSLETKSSLSLTPFALLGSGLGFSMLLSNKERLSETQAFYGVYGISRKGIDYIIDKGINEIRIPTKSKYVSLTGFSNRYNSFLTWLESSLSNVENRSLYSVNTIEDDIDVSTK